MMKIHTTQNLDLGNYQPTCNFYKSNYWDYNSKPRSYVSECSDSVSFEGKESGKGRKLVKKAVDKTKELMKKTANEGNNKNPVGSLFDRFLVWAGEQEVMVQSTIALILCVIARPAAIMLFKGDKDENNCKLASSHSIASGILGFIVPFICIRPVKKGYDHALKNVHKHLSLEKIVERWPHVDKNSVLDKFGKVKPMHEWLDYAGHKFSPDMKEAMKVPLPKHISEVSEKTLEEKCPNIDLSTVKNNAPDKWLDKSGNKIDIKMDDIYLAVEEGAESEPKYYSFKHASDELLEEMFDGLDVKSTKDANGKRIDYKLWKNKDKSNFELDPNSIFLSSWNDTYQVRPLITGKEIEVKGKKGEKIKKDVTYQLNSEAPGELGTPLTEEMYRAREINEVHDKLAGWLPDILIAYPRAVLTIALIPWILKNVFHLEKTPTTKVSGGAK